MGLRGAYLPMDRERRAGSGLNPRLVERLLGRLFQFLSYV